MHVYMVFVFDTVIFSKHIGTDNSTKLLFQLLDFIWKLFKLTIISEQILDPGLKKRPINFKKQLSMAYMGNHLKIQNYFIIMFHGRRLPKIFLQELPSSVDNDGQICFNF